MPDVFESPASRKRPSCLDVLDELRGDPRYARHITAWRRLEPQPARHAPELPPLHPRLLAGLPARGVEHLYTHQADAISAILAGRHVVVVTPTASGKTLCYNLPVLNALLTDPEARALYIFPTKALAQDQLAELRAWEDVLQLGLRPATYDGDTPPAARGAIREGSRIVITNPDMLHVGILPHHTRWASFFAGLRYVVVDEMHAYRGVFGSHVANVVRRLKRVARFYGAHPQFLCASATIANPEELARLLIGDSSARGSHLEPIRKVDGAAFPGCPGGLESPPHGFSDRFLEVAKATDERADASEEEVVVVANDGSPKGTRHFLFYNPPLVDRDLGIRRSAVLETQTLVRLFLDRNVQTIVFARSRLSTELLLRYLRQGAAQQDKVRGYRGGYLPRERREIEQGLREGAVRTVVATNALELGIDIGQLDACLMAGYPGTIASTWQQAGRAGRRADVSVAILVAGGNPLEQYIVTHPDYFFGRSPEHGRINPDNLLIRL
ncbi:MAG: DEAD/DEAH box helicase, partial [Anaerolineae bacterium]